ncbi:hypothetical protein G3I67_13250 [Orrella sp. NBD-18]|uniref:Uncharacterized protein n=1 Tax=Sheuella amnicola TaxID=2707330 RepID=A0A6B2R3B6_9BURK|nr:hypothetical protein [Sheuella amnicola]NDY84194.1 hypothetical protein [Sheuella amnicola]HBI83969.1 hypothetical protein [Alcaligenaceae bacterium]
MTKHLWFYVLGVFALAIGLTGCTPEYNWRETSVAEDRAMVAFPSKVQTEQRSLSVDGVNLKFSLTSSIVGQSVFSVGYLKLPSDWSVGATDRLIKGMVDSLMSRSSREPDSDLIAKAIKGDVFEVQATVGQQPSRMMAKIFVHQGVLLQVVVSGPAKELSAENAKEFMRSLTLK